MPLLTLAQLPCNPYTLKHPFVLNDRNASSVNVKVKYAGASVLLIWRLKRSVTGELLICEVEADWREPFRGSIASKDWKERKRRRRVQRVGL